MRGWIPLLAALIAATPSALAQTAPSAATPAGSPITVSIHPSPILAKVGEPTEVAIEIKNSGSALLQGPLHAEAPLPWLAEPADQWVDVPAGGSIIFRVRIGALRVAEPALLSVTLSKPSGERIAAASAPVQLAPGATPPAATQPPAGDPAAAQGAAADPAITVSPGALAGGGILALVAGGVAVVARLAGDDRRDLLGFVKGHFARVAKAKRGRESDD